MMVWFWAYKLKLFPIGKFLNPVLWRNAPVDANYVFNRILVTLFISSVIIFIIFLYARRLDPARRMPVRIVGIGLVLFAALFYWINTGVAVYAADIFKAFF